MFIRDTGSLFLSIPHPGSNNKGREKCVVVKNRNNRNKLFQNKPKQTNRNNPKFCEKIPKYALYPKVGTKSLFC
jgi:hypothetical protein